MCLRFSKYWFPWWSLDNGGFEKVLDMMKLFVTFFFFFGDIFCLHCLILSVA